VWVTSEQDDTVTRIDPKTRTAVRTFAVGGPPVDVAIGATFVWVLSSAHTQSARITQIDPRHNAVLLTRAVGTGSVGFGSASSVAIAAGAVWVVNYEAPVSISRIDAETSEVTSTFSVGGPSLGFNTGTAGGVRQGAGIAAAQQSLWVAGDFAVARIGATSHAVVARIPLRVGVPTAVAVGAGAVWVAARPGFRCCPAEDVGTGTLTRIDPETNSIDATIPVGGTPTAVAVGEGAVWLADPARRSVVRVDPHANRVVERIKTGAPPRGVAARSGAVWVSVG
jgi:YVTN family beta-propeller protein